MCRAVKCRRCGKTTWAGCGMHVDQVMTGVSRDDRCRGHQKEAGSGFWARLFGK